MSDEIRTALTFGGSEGSSGVSRRTLIKSAALGAALVGAGGALSACAAGGGGGAAGGSESQAAGEKTADNPFGVDKKAPLEVVIFDGGYGDEYGKAHVALYNDWAGSEVAKMTSTVKIATTLQPRFAGGTPPEVIDNSGADAMPTSALVDKNQLADLQPLLDAPSIDDPNTKIGDLMLPGAVEGGSFDGVFRQLGYVFSMWGFWYSKPLFDKNGWEPAKTWDDFFALCKEIKDQGKMAPFIHTGVHTQYMMNILTTMAIKHGGKDIMLGLDNLKPDAWANDSVLTAAKAVEKLYKDGYIMKGAEGMDHTTSQTQWLLGKAAVIPCGSWLENEMKGKVPEGFDMVVQPIPSLTSSDKMPFETLNGGAGEPFIVSEQAKNKPGAYEYLRRMLSKEGATKFSASTGSLVAVKGAGEDLKNPSTALKSVSDATAAAGDNVVSVSYAGWYAEMNDAGKREMANLTTGRSNADQFVAAMQKACDAVASDPKVKKYSRS
ncbi:N-acetylglucosamine/diacetylchitobiose ABC transporter substrate-binding protein [Microlunatus panaciterrae]|uniref:N-acetylglucosamine transport system substrate-binding protein n=1 Tax=Microlunatus panaciterrae TaxID=400768 RepID=A0ABS2REI4_9ACTN|nr:N-acetylglucosamine/diacetylchitobiose ABC transporter substrate-binding protein [Microlunatus panaciterrae]MBM7797414.1 N-acetylglucosamine transport system substrate-binding protein [Microlunatus panaciterrae]